MRTLVCEWSLRSRLLSITLLGSSATYSYPCSAIMLKFVFGFLHLSSNLTSIWIYTTYAPSSIFFHSSLSSRLSSIPSVYFHTSGRMWIHAFASNAPHAAASNTRTNPGRISLGMRGKTAKGNKPATPTKSAATPAQPCGGSHPILQKDSPFNGNRKVACRREWAASLRGWGRGFLRLY